MEKRKSNKKRWAALGLLLLLLAAYLAWQNNSLTVSRHSYQSAQVPEAFSGFRIVHISDLHNKSFGKEQSRLLERVAAEAPDIIVITGDIVDSNHFDIQPAMAFASGAAKLAPVYYVTGNHEIRGGKWPEVEQALLAAGVVVLDGKTTAISRGGSEIQLIGFGEKEPMTRLFTDAEIIEKNDVLQILLAHHPEHFSNYYACGADVIFSGHAHGGQIRLPFIGGLFAPNQGLFPAYTAGAYTQGDATMYVSRGLGNSLFPFRIGNRPEILSVTLQNGEAPSSNN